MPTLTLIFIVGTFAGVVSGMLGGGSGLVLMPFLLLLGVDPKIATVTTHFGFVGVSFGSLRRFSEEGVLRGQYIIPLLIISIISALVGPQVLLSFDTKEFQKIISILILCCIPLFLLKKNLSAAHRESPLWLKTIGYITLTLIFTLQVAFGAATGVLAIFASVYFLGLSLIETNAILRVPNLLSSVFALVFYALYGNVNYEYGFTLLGAMAIGGYIGSHLAIKGGEKFVRYAFTTFATILATAIIVLG